MKIKTWRQQSITIIHEHFLRLKREGIEKTDSEIVEFINKNHYPFGERKRHPYQSWCEAMKDFKRVMRIK